MRLVMATPHVPIRRLLNVAINDDVLTSEEYGHLKECAECFNEWAIFVKAVPESQRPPSTLRSPKADS
jgi:hypothetical protein